MMMMIVIMYRTYMSRSGGWASRRPSDQAYIPRQPLLPVVTACAWWVQRHWSQVRSNTSTDHWCGNIISSI